MSYDQTSRHTEPSASNGTNATQPASPKHGATEPQDTYRTATTQCGTAADSTRTKTRIQNPADDLLARHEHLANVLHLRKLFVIALAAWTVFALVDWYIVEFVYSGRLWFYLTLRAVGLVLLGGMCVPLFGVKTPSPRLIRVLESVTMVVLAACLSVSAIEFNGIASPLAMGVILVLVARAAVISDHWKRAIIPIGLTVVTYPLVMGVMGLFVAPVAAQFQSLRASGLFLLNCMFIFTTGAITLAGGHVIWTLRRQIYRTRSLGRYRLIRKLDSGGMGEVWIAHHRTLCQEVAVKILRPDSHIEPNAVARFEREVRATAELKHPNIVRVYDFGTTDDGLCYYAMELLEGEHLGKLVEREENVPPLRALRLVLQASQAIAEAHERGIVHRDIKPQNIFVTRINKKIEFVKVLDFGLALYDSDRRNTLTPHLTQEGLVVGTIPYMSPERFTGGEADQRSDVYALGGVLYFLLSGNPPSDFINAQRLHDGRAPAHAGPVSNAADAILPPIEQVIRRCLSERPDDRYQSAVELAAALEECVGIVGN